MTTRELITWANNAQDIKESSWNLEKENSYGLTLREATEKCRPQGALDVEADMVTCINHNLWNEVADWKKGLED